MKNKELPKWAEEPFDDTKYIPIEFIQMVKKLHAQNEGYYNYIGEKELAEQEAHYAMCLISLLREWENNRPQWAEHIPNVHTPTVDAVKHAKWEINIFDGGHSCSRCGSVGKKEYNYCPICGAKMDEE